MPSSVQLTTAVNLAVTSDWKNQSGSLSVGDSSDVYQFTLAKASTLNLNLGAIGTGTAIALVKDGNGNQQIDAAEILSPLSQADNISTFQLAAGTYYVVAELTDLAGSPSASYQVGMSLASHSTVLWRDTANNGEVGLWTFGMTPQGPLVTSSGLIFSQVDEHWKVEAIGDFNGDGVSDVFWRNQSSHDTTVWLLDEQANLISTDNRLNAVDQNWVVIGAGDLDGDGKDDLIWRSKFGTESGVWRMDGQQVVAREFLTNAAGETIHAPNHWKLEQVADWNGDGKADLFWRNEAIDPAINQVNNTIGIWLMNGKQIQDWFDLGSVRPEQGFEVRAIGDVDGNGTTDIVWGHADGRVHLWTMDQQGRRSAEQVLTNSLPTNWKIVGMNDVTGDGKADILWQDQATKQLFLWQMNGLTIQNQFEVQGTELTLGRSAVAMMQRPMNPAPEIMVSLSVSSDTGISNSDGITKVRSPEVSGIAMPSATVTLYANHQIVGSTIADSTGAWSIVSQELADGSYDLSVSIQPTQGNVIQRNVKSITIDGTAPTLNISGVFNGIDWLATDQLNAQISDLGSGLVDVTYQLNAQSPIAWTGSNGNWSKSVGELLDWNDPQNQRSHTLTVRGIDVAGNEQIQTLKFAIAKPLDWVDNDVWTDDPIDSTDPGNNPGTNPDHLTGAPVGGSGVSAIYGWGSGGYWGYSVNGQWYSSPYNSAQGVLSDPQWFPRDPNPPIATTYRQRLTQILSTAIAAIPGTSTDNQAKKAALKNRMSLLIEAGVIHYGDSESLGNQYQNETSHEFKGWLDRFFLGSLEKAKNPGISTMELGLALAKDLIESSASIRLQTFQTLVEMAIGVVQRYEGGGLPYYRAKVQQWSREIARLYGLLKPQGNTTTGAFAWLDQLWDLTENPNRTGAEIRLLLFNPGDRTHGIVGQVIQVMNAVPHPGHNFHHESFFRMTEGLLRSSLKVESLKSDLESAEVVNELLQLGYEIVKVNPSYSISAHATDVSTWIRTILEKGDERLVAAGLSDFLGGVTEKSDRLKTLQFAQRLVKSIDSDLATSLDLFNAEVLSEMVNLSSIYTRSGKYPALSNWNQTGRLEDFFKDVWNYVNSQDGDYQESLKDLISLAGFIKVSNNSSNTFPILVASDQIEGLLAGLESGSSKLVSKVAQRSLKWLAGKGDNISAHITKRHIATALGKTTFSNGGKEVKKWVTRTVENPTKVIDQGRRMVFEKSFGRSVGIGGEKVIRVIVDKATGKIVTAFPTKSLMSISGVGVSISLRKANEAEDEILRIRQAHERAGESGWLERLIDFLNPIDAGGTVKDDIFLKERKIIDAKVQEAIAEIIQREGSEISDDEYQAVKETILFQMNLTY